MDIKITRYANGAGMIEGWVDGHTTATVRWKGTEDAEVYTRTITSEREALGLLGSIEHYVNLELVSAAMDVR